MDIGNVNGASLRNLTRVNVILGKNGCGKSYLLKHFEQNLRNNSDYGRIRYVSPERGGNLTYDAGIDQAIGSDPNWLLNTRNKNQSENFRQQSVTLFRRLELLFLRQMEQNQSVDGYVPEYFQNIVEEINSLLDRVRIERHNEKGFEIFDRQTGEPTPAGQISSGESELVSLGIEFLSFRYEAENDKTNILLVDEPDVHLHPDLQDRLARFIVNAFEDSPVTTILATHSTALLAGLATIGDTSVSFMRLSDLELSFQAVSDIDRAILPIFGAHPLSNVFNQSPILLVEGEDDERIWQQAVRSSQGNIRLHPCVAGNVERLNLFENAARDVVESVYDNAIGYSVRDRDLDPEEIGNLGSIVRMRLSCRASENLMLSDDALNIVGSDWNAFTALVEHWAKINVGHQYHEEVAAFVAGGFERKRHDIKDIRNILIGLVTNKPWEVVVGQAIGQLTIQEHQHAAGSLRNFLGEKICHNLLKLDPL